MLPPSKNLKKLMIASGLVLFATQALASSGSVTNTTITHIEGEPNGNFFFYFAANITGGPTCANQPQTGFVVDGTSEGGKVIVSMVLAAYELGKTVSASGAGTCNVHGGYEDISDFYTTN